MAFTHEWASLDFRKNDVSKIPKIRVSISMNQDLRGLAKNSKFQHIIVVPPQHRTCVTTPQTLIKNGF